MEIGAVIFDMDGVLVDTVEYHYHSWKKISSELGIPFSREDNDKFRGLSRRRCFELLLGDIQLAEAEISEWLARKNEYFIDSISRMTSADILPGVVRLFQELKEAHIPIGVSSSSENAAIVLDRLGIRKMVVALGDANCVQHVKPAPDVFLYSASRLQVSPETCMVVEDGEVGVQAGHAAGMCVIGLGPESRVGAADAVFADLTSVRLRHLREIFDFWWVKRTEFLEWQRLVKNYSEA